MRNEDNPPDYKQYLDECFNQKFGRPLISYDSWKDIKRLHQTAVDIRKRIDGLIDSISDPYLKASAMA